MEVTMNFEHGRTTIVKTDKGLIRGFKNYGIYHYYGIDYAKSTRFMPPVETDCWEGVKDAVNYGFISYPFRPYKIGNNLKNPHRFWPQSENCQNLNVWTKNINSEIKKPVIVWFHGGGFFDGSSIEQVAYDGFNLCQYGDVVVVTVNHRLNIFGYLDLSKFSDKYQRSANVGNLDLIAALKWVNRNIENFGGDKDNVTIFGQSGGGIKVTTVMNMPASAGLYNKAMIMSGTMGHQLTDAGRDMSPNTKKMLEILGIKENEVEKLELLSHKEIADAYLQAYKDLGGAGMLYVGPVRNVDYLGDPLYYGFSDIAKKTPLIVGSVFSEFFTLPEKYKRYEMSERDMVDAIEEELGKEVGDKLIPLFKETFPEKKLIDLLTYDCGAARGASKEFVHKRIEAGCAATYNYFFTAVFGINEGQTALHSSDIPFIFHNTDKVPSTDLGKDTVKLENNMSGRFINFAKTGKPQLEGEEYWPACEIDKEATMVFDRVSKVRYDFDTELLDQLSKVKTYTFGLI